MRWNRTKGSLAATVAFLSGSIAAAGVNYWTPLGPGGATVGSFETGKVLAADPLATGVVYLGLGGDQGIFKTTDGGANWVRKSLGIPRTEGIAAVGSSPLTPGLVLALSTTRQIYRSTDGGTTWSLSSSGLAPAPIRTGIIVFHPTNPAIVYFGCGRALTGTLFRSGDAGVTWSSWDTGLTNDGTYALLVAPTDPPVLFAAGNLGVYRRAEGDAGWTACNGSPPNNLPFTSTPSTDYYMIKSLAVSSTEPPEVYTIGRDGKLYLTSDGGSTWTAPSTEPAPFAYGMLAVDPSSGDLYAAGEDRATGEPSYRNHVYRQHEDLTWEDLTPGHFAAYLLAFDPLVPGRIYATLDEGIYRSDDGGASWESASDGLRAVAFSAIAFAPGLPSTFFAGSNGSGLFKTTDGGTSFVPINDGLCEPVRSYTIAISADDPQMVLSEGFPKEYVADYTAYSLVKSTDGGAHWQAVMKDDPAADGWGGVFDMAVDPADPDGVYFAAPGTGVFATTDFGDSIDDVTAGLPGPDVRYYVEAVAALATTPTTWLVGFWPLSGDFPGLYRKLSTEDTWSPSGTGMDALSDVVAIAPHPADPAVVFAGTRGGALYKSTDYGQNWVKCGGGLPAGHVFAVAIEPDTPTRVYAGVLTSGVYRSDDGGATWQAMNAGLGSLAVWKLVIDPGDSRRLIAATAGGLWEITVEPEDDDADGVTAAEEDGAPNGGDGNSDGVLDSEQANVASLHEVGGEYVTIASPEGTELADVVALPPPSGAPPDVTFPSGAFQFVTTGMEPGSCTVVTLFFPKDDSITTYYKYGRTPAYGGLPENSTPHWYEFAWDGTIGAEIFQDPDQTRILLHLCDGLPGDQDLVPNGSTDDPGGPAAAGIPVSIDIKPGSDVDCINVNGHGVIPVALLGSETFSVREVDQPSLVFAGLPVATKGHDQPQCIFTDVDRDGHEDLLCKFADNRDDWQPGGSIVTLTGSLSSGVRFTGSDVLCIRP